MTQSTQTAGPTPTQALALYERMLLIRRMEEKLSADSAAGVLPGAVHLYIGQEAVAAGVCMQLRETDWITSTHRGHGHGRAEPARRWRVHATRRLLRLESPVGIADGPSGCSGK